jgi:hypothetical protein
MRKGSFAPGSRLCSGARRPWASVVTAKLPPVSRWGKGCFERLASVIQKGWLCSKGRSAWAWGQPVARAAISPPAARTTSGTRLKAILRESFTEASERSAPGFLRGRERGGYGVPRRGG